MVDFSRFERFKVFLLDLDGLLVDTEPRHYQAYQQMLQQQGYTKSPWKDYDAYSSTAYKNNHSIADTIYKAFPQLQQEYPEWEVLRQRKQDIVIELFLQNPIKMMPGAEGFLEWIKTANKISCVVTNSSQELVNIIYDKCSILQNIDHWILRGRDYTRPKPHPESYLQAIQKYGQGADCIGFEDTEKGIQALCQTSAQPVLICPEKKKPKNPLLLEKVWHFSSFESL